MSILLGSLRAASLGLIASFVVTAAANDPNYTALRDAPLAETFVVENVVLRRDAGIFTLKSGFLSLTAPILGRDTVAVFNGEGEFTLIPATPIEKNYLKSLTAQEAVAEAFDRALFSFTDGAGQELRSQLKTKAVDPKAADLLRDIRKRLRNRQGTNVEAELLADLYRAGQPGQFNAYLHGRKRSDLRFHVNPRGVMAEFGPEEVFLTNIQPTDVPDQWLYLGHLQSEISAARASSDEDKRSLEALAYRIQTSIAENERLTGTAELRLRATAGGERILPVNLLPTLRVSRVTSDGQEAGFIQQEKDEDGGLYVVLPQAWEKGSEHVLVLDYQGDKVIRDEGGGNFSVGARTSWYPNVNSFKDHAAYDLTFKVPKRYTLVSVGKMAKQWTEQDFACSQWISEHPIAVAGFNYGTFRKKQVTESESGITVEGYATSRLPAYLADAVRGSNMSSISPASLLDQTLVEAQNALRLYSSFFGKPEFTRLAITQQPEFNFGQSWPSLVYLPLSAYLDSTQRWQLMGIQNSLTEFIDEVGPHEVSHQWWGHMVGWSSYHDQWLSEGFAEFSAGLYLQYTNKSADKYLKYLDGIRHRLLEKNEFGRRANDAGPVWLGYRLASEKNDGAVSRVMYGKGGYILHMVRMLMWDPKDGDKFFIEMMRDFVQSHRNRNASTESFKATVEKHMRPTMNLMGNGKMDWFFNEWVYGTAVPRYKLDYVVTPEPDGKFLVKGSVIQSDVPPDFVMSVPIYLEFENQTVRMGAARITGNNTIPLEVRLQQKPKRVLLNVNRDVLEQ